MDQQRLDGRIAIVTGGGAGIGAASAMALAQAGATVVINHRPRDSSREAAEKQVAAIAEQGGSAVAMPADVSDEAQIETLFAQTIERFGKLDILVNNAGIEKPADFDQMTLADWNAVMDVNMTGQFLCARAAVRHFKTRKPDNGDVRAVGNIVFISSVHEVIPWAFQTNYAASKGGVMLLMKSLAQEVAPYKIRVNSIAPGAIRTKINKEAWDSKEKLAELLKLIPYGRIGEPEDVGRAVRWLASDDSDYVTGTTLFVDGGMTLYPGFRGAG